MILVMGIMGGLRTKTKDLHLEQPPFFNLEIPVSLGMQQLQFVDPQRTHCIENRDYGDADIGEHRHPHAGDTQSTKE